MIMNNLLHIFLFCILVLFLLYLIYSDKRFLFNRKFLFFFIILSSLFFSYYMNKIPYLIIKDLFWYSLILNCSFIFHVLILDRLFYWCWQYHYEYFGFIISRISFTFSFSCLLSLLRIFIEKLIRYQIFIKYNVNIINSRKDIIIYILDFIKSLCNLIRLILIHFSIIFQNYCLLLIGKNIKQITMKNIIKNIIIFIIFFIIAWIIGIPRLYVVWIFQSIFESYNMIFFEYNKVYKIKKYYFIKIKDKLQYFISQKKEIILYFISNFSKIMWLSNYFDKKYCELEEIYEKPYHDFFIFNLCKFLKDPNLDRKFLSEGFQWPDDYNPEIFIFPITKIYIFYPWKEITLGYCTVKDKALKLYWNNCIEYYEEIKRSDEERIIEAISWCDFINSDYSLLKEILPDIIKTDLDIAFVSNLKKNNYV